MVSQGSRTVVVTGASAGVGRATAIAFAAHGDRVALLARGSAGLEAAAKDVEAAGGEALTVEADVASWADVKGAAATVEDRLGPIDVWVNNAMTTVFARFADVEPDEFVRATEVTYFGQVFGTMAALQRMRPRDHGTIVSVGSGLAFVGIPLQAAYCGAKFATRGFVESVRSELLAEGSHVRLVTVHLPAVNTPQFDWCLSKLPEQPRPVPPVYQPDVCAAAIVAAVASGKPARVLGGWNRAVVWASRLAPQTVAHFAARTGVASQQDDIDVPAERRTNLYAPVDDQMGGDHGARGRFDGIARGVADPGFLRSLPKTLLEIARAGVASRKESLDAAVASVGREGSAVDRHAGIRRR